MVTKGIITELVGSTQAKVRIPIYDKANSALDATPDSELSTAIICTFPGGSPNYSVGDVVIVAFEQDIFSMPVILGLLYRKSIKTHTDANFGTLNVSLNANLPTETKIGDITYNQLYCINNVRGNIQNQLDVLNSKIVNVKGFDCYIDPEHNNLVILDVNQLIDAEPINF